MFWLHKMSCLIFQSFEVNSFESIGGYTKTKVELGSNDLAYKNVFLLLFISVLSLAHKYFF